MLSMRLLVKLSGIVGLLDRALVVKDFATTMICGNSCGSTLFPNAQSLRHYAKISSDQDQ